MTEDSSSPYLAALKVEHRELAQLVRTVEGAFSAAADQGWKGERTLQVVERLAAVRDFMRDHFAREEEGGYLDEAISHAPRLGPEAARLERQHPQLLGKINDAYDEALKQHSSPREGDPFAWPTIQETTHAVLKELLTHEAGENQLLMQAFNADPRLTE